MNPTLCPRISLLVLAGYWWVVPQPFHGFVCGTFAEVPNVKQGNPETLVRKERPDFLSLEVHVMLVRGVSAEV